MYACDCPVPVCAPLPVSVQVPGSLTPAPVSTSTEEILMVPRTGAVTVAEQVPCFPLESVTVAFPGPAVPNFVMKLTPVLPDEGVAFGDADQKEYGPVPPVALKVTGWFTETLVGKALQVGDPGGTLSHLIKKVTFPFAASDCVEAGETSWNMYPAGAAPCARVYEPAGSLGYVCVTPLPLCGEPLPVSVHPGALTLLPVAKSTELTVIVPVPGTAFHRM